MADNNKANDNDKKSLNFSNLYSFQLTLWYKLFLKKLIVILPFGSDDCLEQQTLNYNNRYFAFYKAKNIIKEIGVIISISL